MDAVPALAPYFILVAAVISFLLAVQAAIRKWAWPVVRRVWALFVIAEAEINPPNGGGLLAKIDSHGDSLTHIKSQVSAMNGRVSEHIEIAKSRDTQLDELDGRVTTLEADRT